MVRQRDRDDRRRVNVLLTEAGVRMKEAGSVLEPDRVRALIESLKPAERRVAIQGLELLAGAANEMMKQYGRSEVDAT